MPFGPTRIEALFHVKLSSEMALKERILTFFILNFVWSLLVTFTVCNVGEKDIYCLKSIKASIEDPHNHLASWNFHNNGVNFVCQFKGVECWEENRVWKIKLSNMGLKGQFPRGIENYTSLEFLHISMNNLSGHIPSDISKMLSTVTELDLSSNSFSGKIPSSLASCFYLYVLTLDNNLLTGRIPPQLGMLTRIGIFSVANNLLSGPVPNFVCANFTQESYANNRKLCGGPLDACEEAWMDFYDSFTKGSMVAWAVCTLSVFLIVHCVPGLQEKMMMKIVMLLMTRKKNKRKPATIQPVLQEGHEEISMLEKFIARMSYTELSNATSNFSHDNVIGLGKMGTMYKAALPDGLFFAVNRLHVSQHSKKHFMSELMTIGRLRHINLVPLVGFCIERKERFLVYNYMSNGNLYDWLQHFKIGDTTMEWPTRAKIAIGLARGLAWLHHRCNLRVIHLDISSKCILLNENFEPKISNFGTAMFMDPNDSDLSKTFFANSVLRESNLVKKDVYKFGFVLLELITGQDSIKNMFSFHCLLWTLVERVKYLSSSSAILYDAVDKSLIGQGFDDEIFHFLRIACNCVHSLPDQRPTMPEVYKMLKAVGERNGLTNEIVAADSGEE